MQWRCLVTPRHRKTFDGGRRRDGWPCGASGHPGSRANLRPRPQQTVHLVRDLREIRPPPHGGQGGARQTTAAVTALRLERRRRRVFWCLREPLRACAQGGRGGLPGGCPGGAGAGSPGASSSAGVPARLCTALTASLAAVAGAALTAMAASRRR